MKEFRKLMCVWLINWCFTIMPKCNFKVKFSEFLKENLMDF